MNSQPLSTGTTCVGVKFKDGIVLASDRRVTAGNYIAKDSEKKVFIFGKRVGAAFAGVVSDAQLYSSVIKAEIKLLELNKEREVMVKEAAMIAKNIQYRHVRTPTTIEPIVGYIVGGYDDVKGPQLYEIGADGSLIERDKFVAIGSGSVLIVSMLGSKYKEGLSEKEAVELAKEVLISAMSLDSATGGGIVGLVIKRDGINEIESMVVSKELKKEK